MKKTHLSEEMIKDTIAQINDFFPEYMQKTYDYFDLIKSSEYQECDRIVVVGPQRSGTTFIAQALSQKKGWVYIDESKFKVNDINGFLSFVKRDQVVIQAPALTHLIHRLIGINTLVIFSVRNWNHILSSVYRKNGYLSDWIFADTVCRMNLESYSKLNSTDGWAFETYSNYFKGKYYLNIIYEMWNRWQYQKVIDGNSYPFNLDYDSMSSHPMWVDAKNRINWGAKQTN